MENIKKKILIISGEAWRDESNGGNVLSNLFEPLKNDFEFAQIYTNPSKPNNKLCNKYFHLSESQMLKSVINRKPFGRVLKKEEYSSSNNSAINRVTNSSYFILIRLFFGNILYFLQNILWSVSVWKSNELERFVKEYNPDVIFAPLYSGIYIHKIDRLVANITQKKIISYVSDDVFTFRQFSFSPFFWINRLILRRNVIKTSKYYSLLYTMTKEQKEEYEKALNVPMKVLKKVGDFKNPEFKDSLNNPLQIIYGGNLIYNRYKTLHQLFNVIKEINENGVKIQLKIFTQTPLTDKLRNLLHDGENSFLLGKISMKELNEEYKKSDMVLHVESFDLKQKLLTRLSFSTKIIDLMHSARCIIAICWSESSPYKYLKSEDAAVCIANVSEIKTKMLELINNQDLIKSYSRKAWDCGVRNHNSDHIIAKLKEDFKILSS